jgi:hypothetical protein
MRRKRSRFPRRDRGQTLVLAAVLILISSLSLFMTFNVVHAVHEKIRIQNAADAQAYSMAVEEARAFNYFAVTNRAIAGAYVAMTILSAYHAEITTGADADWAAAIGILSQIIPEELAESQCPFTCMCVIHCAPHIPEDLYNAGVYMGDAGNLANLEQSLDPLFNSAMKDWYDLVDALEKSQQAMYSTVYAMVQKGAVALVDASGNNINMPSVNSGTGKDAYASIGTLNAQYFKNAIYNQSGAHRPKEMGDAINAAVPGWPASMSSVTVVPAVLAPLNTYLQNVTGAFTFTAGMLPNGGNSAGVVQGVDNSPKPGQNVDTVGASANWMLVINDDHDGETAFMPLPLALGFPAQVNMYTNNGAGDHSGWGFNSGHQSGLDHQDLNFQQQLGANAGFPFMEFNSDPSKPTPKTSGNQPVVYGYVRQDLKVDEAGKQPPWVIGNNGDLQFGLWGSSELHIGDSGTGAAIAKAVAYYHRPRDWAELPNFFNPYWRAKLHPFGKTEAVNALNAAGESDGATLVTGTGIGCASDNQAMTP